MEEHQSPAHTEFCKLVQSNAAGTDWHIVSEICGTARLLTEESVISILESLKSREKGGECVTTDRVLDLLTEQQLL